MKILLHSPMHCVMFYQQSLLAGQLGISCSSNRPPSAAFITSQPLSIQDTEATM